VYRQDKSPLPPMAFHLGGRILLDMPRRESVFVMGGQVALQSEVRDSVFILGGRVVVSGKVGKDLYVLAGRLDVSPNAVVAGEANILGGDIYLDGTVLGDVNIIGGSVILSGKITGDVKIYGGQIVVMPTAKIQGRLQYGAGGSVRIQQGAQIHGGVVRYEPKLGKKEKAEPKWWSALQVNAIWLLGLLFLGGLICAVMPGVNKRTLTKANHRPWMSLGLGIAALILAPILVVLAVISVVGIPLAIVLILSFMLFVMVSILYSYMWLGTWLLKWMKRADFNRRLWQWFAVVIGGVLLYFLYLIPYVGKWVGFILLIFMLGAFLSTLFGSRQEPA